MSNHPNLKLPKNILQQTLQKKDSISALSENQKLLQQYSQKYKKSFSRISDLKPDQFKEFLTYIYSISKANLIQNPELKSEYFQLYLTKGPKQALQYLGKKSSFDVDDQKQQLPTVNMLESLNEDYLSTEASSSGNSDSDQDSQISEVKNLKRFQQGKKVRNLQLKLKQNKFLTKVDGFFGPETERALEKYQKSQNIKEDGLPGQHTLEKLNLDQKSSQKNKLKNDKEEQKVGGISMNITQSKLPTIQGVSFSSQDFSDLKFLQNSSDNSDIKIEDLAIGLKVYYDRAIKCKNISFSLDPYEETNPEGPYMRKITLPDKFEKKCILQNTKFNDILFESDYLLKKLSLGVEEDSKSQFKYPEELRKKGLKPISEYNEEKKDKNQNHKSWARLWFVCDKVDFQKFGESYKITGIKIGVQAKQMQTDKNGKLQDSVLQDKTDASYIFAQKMTELYEDLCKYYPILIELKALYKAVALSKWMAKNQMPVDLKVVNQLIEKQRIQNFSDKVNSIQLFSKEFQTEEQKVEVDIRTVAERSLKQGGHEVNEKNIEFAIKQIREKEPDRKFYDVKTYQKCFHKGVLGGVDMNFDIQVQNVTSSQNSQRLQQKPIKNTQKSVNQQQQQQRKCVKKGQDFDQFSEDNSDISTQLSSSDVQSNTVFQKEIDIKIPFIFAPKEECFKCKNELGMMEMKFPIENKFYCTIHHPYSCFYCNELVQQGNKIKGNKELYDSTSFVEKEVFFHPECLENFQIIAQDQYLLKQQGDHVEKLKKDVLNHLQKMDPKIANLSSLQLKQPLKFTCNLCKHIQTQKSIICKKCQKPDENMVNTVLREKFQPKK